MELTQELKLLVGGHAVKSDSKEEGAVPMQILSDAKSATIIKTNEKKAGTGGKRLIGSLHQHNFKKDLNNSMNEDLIHLVITNLSTKREID